MLTQTTVTAVRLLVHIGLAPGSEPWSVRQIAEALDESPTYLAKVTRHLAKAGILRVHCGVRGGAVLNRAPAAITLRAVVEACQGTILADFCQETESLDKTCAFHVAVAGLHQAMVDVLSRWTLEDLLERPGPCGRLRREVSCLITPHGSAGASPSLGHRVRPRLRQGLRTPASIDARSRGRRSASDKGERGSRRATSR